MHGGLDFGLGGVHFVRQLDYVRVGLTMCFVLDALDFLLRWLDFALGRFDFVGGRLDVVLGRLEATWCVPKTELLRSMMYLHALSKTPTSRTQAFP